MNCQAMKSHGRMLNAYYLTKNSQFEKDICIIPTIWVSWKAKTVVPVKTLVVVRDLRVKKGQIDKVEMMFRAVRALWIIL
jgi:hypothetical protein